MLYYSTFGLINNMKYIILLFKKAALTGYKVGFFII